MVKQELGPLQTEWVEALESGRYKQTKRYLHRKNDEERFCCLGVACAISVAIVKKTVIEESDGGECVCYDGHDSILPPAVQSLFGFFNADALMSESGERPEFAAYIKEHEISTLENKRTTSLTKMNDTGSSFVEIAAFVREFPELTFKKPV